MKNYINNLLGCAILLSVVAACETTEQDVAAIVPPTDNAIATITPQEEYTNVEEGDTLYFDVTVDKLVRQAIDFSAVFNENSVADASDVEVISGTLPAFSYTTTIAVVVVSDGLAEPMETFSFELNADDDMGYNFQLNPNSDSEVVNISASNYDITLDYSAGMHEGADMCSWGVDFDLVLFNADESVVSYDAASSDCPFETASLVNLPDDTYYIYVDNYANELPENANVTIPWTVRVSNNNGDPYELTGEFNSDNAGGEAVVAGQIVISNGTYTVQDADGNTLGTI